MESSLLEILIKKGLLFFCLHIFMGIDYNKTALSVHYQEE